MKRRKDERKNERKKERREGRREGKNIKSRRRGESTAKCQIQKNSN